MFIKASRRTAKWYEFSFWFWTLSSIVFAGKRELRNSHVPPSSGSVLRDERYLYTRLQVPIHTKVRARALLNTCCSLQRRRKWVIPGPKAQKLLIHIFLYILTGCALKTVYRQVPFTRLWTKQCISLAVGYDGVVTHYTIMRQPSVDWLRNVSTLVQSENII